MLKEIIITGAKENNLKNISLVIPRDKLIVMTGVSGSGKSTLAFDTLYAEGQRKFIESLSSYARQFLDQMKKPEVEKIEGLSPAISIDQKTTSHNPRSTVGTVTEIYDYLRLLYASVGDIFCPDCNKKIAPQTIDQILDKLQTFKDESKLVISAPVIKGKKGSYLKEINDYRKKGYSRIIIDGEVHMLDEEINIDKNKKHDISVVVDRLILREESRKRLADSVESALGLANGTVVININEKKHLFSTNHNCKSCGFSYSEITPRMFSFNNPYGACHECSGLGVKNEFDEELIVPNKDLTLNEGAIKVNGWNNKDYSISNSYFKALASIYKFSLDEKYGSLTSDTRQILMHGNNGEEIEIEYEGITGSGTYKTSFEGVITNLKRRYIESSSDRIKRELSKYIKNSPCPSCEGKRLKKESLSIKVNNLNISQFTQLSIKDAYSFITNLSFSQSKEIISKNIIKEIIARISFLKDVGLDYLTLSRTSGTLSGGESQRIRLATQIGSGLVGVLYILDEPSIGLHQRDNARLLKTLKKIKDYGNTLIVVEHDEETIKSADHIVDIGPYAGAHGGNVVVNGTYDDLINSNESITGQYISGKKIIHIPDKRRISDKGFLSIKGACQNNLKNLDVDIPLGVITAVTGVSGSGKSSLINQILLPHLQNKLNKSKNIEGDFDKIVNYEDLDKVIAIDQSPIGRTPRSNPATYTGVFDPIRELFSKTQESKEKGYKPGRFSFNVSGGRCEACRGNGVNKVEMYFLPDVLVPCDVCGGHRYNKETLNIKYKNKNIYDILNLTVEDALVFFERIPKIKLKLKSLYDVGLGYIKLGQFATTLSGGEAQRVKLATELSKRSTGKTIYILDEPTTGLSMYDIDKLVKILQRLVGRGNTVIIIEHNLDVIKQADYMIDLGPEGGVNGGEVIAMGTPEQVSKIEKSYTGQFLKKIL